MDRNNVRTVVRVTVATLARVSRQTRTPADDLMVAIVKKNEDRIVDAVVKLVSAGGDGPTEAQITEALESVGIRC